MIMKVLFGIFFLIAMVLYSFCLFLFFLWIWLLISISRDNNYPATMGLYQTKGHKFLLDKSESHLDN